MNSGFKKTLQIRMTTIILIALTVLLIISFVLYYKCSTGFYSSIFSSLFVGLFVAIIQYLIQWYDIRANEKTSSLMIKDVLYTRNDKNYYASFLSRASKEIWIMGVTGSRFVNDFGDMDINAPEDAKILINLLNRNVKVRILLPKNDFLSTEDKHKEQQASSKYNSIMAKYKNFEIKYFNHPPSHSIFKVDSECIIGPVFPDISSRNTPAIHMSNNSKLVESYLNYFESEWKIAHV